LFQKYEKKKNTGGEGRGREKGKHKEKLEAEPQKMVMVKKHRKDWRGLMREDNKEIRQERSKRRTDTAGPKRKQVVERIKGKKNPQRKKRVWRGGRVLVKSLILKRTVRTRKSPFRIKEKGTIKGGKKKGPTKIT